MTDYPNILPPAAWVRKEGGREREGERRRAAKAKNKTKAGADFMLLLFLRPARTTEQSRPL